VIAKSNFIALIAAAALASATANVSAQAFSRIINIGDSLSDVGNVNSITGGLYPGQYYYNGRYSNGALWNEDLAVALSLPATKMSRSTGGLDYAVGGSHTGSGNTSFVLPNAGAQVTSFLAANTPTANDLVTIWTGANDFIDGGTNTTTPANNVKAHVQQLVNAGVKNILVINLPPIGETPRYRGTAERATMNTRASQFNSLLSTNLDAIATASPTVTIYRADMFALFNQLLANPAAYGFTNVTDPALRSDNTVVSNPDDYLFYDTIHPTRVGHAQLAVSVLETVAARSWSSAGSGTWSTATNWAQRRVPDATSAVTLSTNTTLDVALGSDVTIRKLRFTPEVGTATGTASLELATNDLNVTSTLDLTGGKIALDLDGQLSPRITVGGAASLGGTLAIGFEAGFIALPGSHVDLMTFGSATGTPAITNDTGFAGLSIVPAVGAAKLSLDFSALAGDSDLDAIVGFADLVSLAQHYDQPIGQTWLDGDFNSDAAVGFGDLVLLAQNYNSSATFAADWALAQSLMPEPTALFALAAIPLVHRYRRPLSIK
jgi:phospholipase/lecithinase/hemolysin